jgi:hypothetical protein
MHCSSKDIKRWKKNAALRKQSRKADERRSRMKLLKPIEPDQSYLIVTKKDGTVLKIPKNQ